MNQVDQARFAAEFSRAASHEVTLGYRGVQLLDPADLRAAQVGYAVSPDGRDLSSAGDGGWRPSWLVVGVDELVDDPLFVDTSDAAWPVFTARHGAGRWDAEPIADSVGALLATLDLVRAAAVGRETPILLEQNPVGADEAADLLAAIARLNPKSSLAFWESLLTLDE